jgi:Family of unknown function (DUF5302)
MGMGIETPAEPEADADADADAENNAPDVFAGDDPKAKFREALARKAGGAGQTDATGGNASKIGAAHGPAKSQRTFRRKSGG